MVFMYLQVDNMEIDFLFEIDNLDLRGYSWWEEPILPNFPGFFP